jgi:diguanylate cyclase (GGDEF)-like protein
LAQERRFKVRSQAEFAVIGSILDRVNTSLTTEEILSVALQGIKESFDCLTVAIIVLEPRREYFKVVNSRGWGNEFIKKFHARPFEGLVADMVTADGPITITAGQSEHLAEGYTFEHEYTELLAIPMGIRGRRIGFMYLSSNTAGALKAGLREGLADLANLCTLVLDHGSLGEQVLSLSNIDPLTGLYSYKFWHEELHREVTRSDLQDLTVSLMTITVNKFKEYNSMHGHIRGDELLIAVSEIIRGELDVLDVPCRVGSKWHVVLTGRDSDDAETVARRMVRAMEKSPPEADSSITIGIGASAYQKGEGEKALIARVDDALREARRQGGNSFHVR